MCWVIDAPLNSGLYQCMEVYRPDGLSEEWLSAVVVVIQKHPGWGGRLRHLLGGYLRGVYLVIFADRLMVTGDTFATCETPSSVLKAAAKIVEAYGKGAR